MNWKIKIALLFFILSACESKQEYNSDEEPHDKKNYLIEIDDLKKIESKANYKILDFRKQEDYQKGHIKGALNIWRTDIENKSYPYSGMMADRFQIESLFSNLGIETNDTIIIYDDNGLCDAARLWWILQNYNFYNVKLLHGGLSAWIANNGVISLQSPSVKKTNFILPKTSLMNYYLSKEDMQTALNTNTVILDTRSFEEYSGKRQKKGASKGGRIPNSVHIDWAEAINYKGDKRLKTIEALEAIYSRLKLTKDDPIIVYCHSGVRSAHTTFVLSQLLAYKNVRNYDGSWTEWSYFNELPFKKDSTTQIIN